MRKALTIIAVLALLVLVGMALGLFARIDQLSTRLIIAVLVIIFLLAFIAALQNKCR